MPALLHAQAAKDITLDDLQEAIRDPQGNAGEVAKRILGERGGNKLFYFPTRDLPATPKDWGYDYEDIHFKSKDGTPLHGWFIPAKGKHPLGTIVFSHGNAGSVGHHLGFVMWMAKAGYNVVMYDYRGFGKSGGSVSRRGMVDDAHAAIAYTMSRPDVDKHKVVSFGHSLGGAKSVTALGEHPVKGLRAVIVDGSFASYRSMARIIGGQLGESVVTDDLSPRDFVEKISPIPFLLVHGDHDEIVPVSQGKELFQKAKQPKTIFEVKGGHHGDSLWMNNGAYRKKVLAWLGEKLK